jgi:hypothetical protein
VSYDDEESALSILDGSCKVVVRRKVTMPKLPHCCWPPSREGCTVGWDGMDVWGDAKGLLVEASGADLVPGCTADVQYIVVWPAKRAAHESDNWIARKRGKHKP